MPVSKFQNFDFLTDGEIDIVLTEKIPADEEKGIAPQYEYKICRHGSAEKMGRLNIRIGDSERVFYDGHIGYGIYPEYRGKHYAAKACLIARQVVVAHGMKTVTLTCDPDNVASRKTCERIGARLLEIVDMPPAAGSKNLEPRKKCRYLWTVQDN